MYQLIIAEKPSVAQSIAAVAHHIGKGAHMHAEVALKTF